MFDLKALDKKTVVQIYVKSPALEIAADCLGTTRYQSDRLIIRTKEAYIELFQRDIAKGWTDGYKIYLKNNRGDLIVITTKE